MKMSTKKLVKRAVPLFDEFKSLWEKWGFEVEPLYKKPPLDFGWAIKWRGALVRPLEICAEEDTSGDPIVYLIWVVSDEMSRFHMTGLEDEEWVRWLRKTLERLTGYLVTDVARIHATNEVKVCIHKSGRPLYVYVSTSDQTYKISFSVGKKTWTWTISRRKEQLRSRWRKVSCVKGRHEENPIPVLSHIIRGLYLSAL
jgi:hypothetical protein